MGPVLIVAAFHPELAPLRSTLGERLEGDVGGVAVLAKAVGIGLVNAAVGTATRLGSIRPRAVVLVGTCGVYAGGPAVGEVVAARRVRLVEPAVVEGRAAIPEPVSLVAAADAAIAQALAAAGAQLADIATTLGVTTDDALAARLAQAASCEAEHLEAFAVATACAAVGVPFGAALGVANAVGSRAREEWRTNHRAAAERAAAVALRAVAAL